MMDDLIVFRRQFFQMIMKENANPCRTINKKNSYIWRDDDARLCLIKIEQIPKKEVLKIIISSAAQRIYIGNTFTLSGVRFQVFKNEATYNFYTMYSSSMDTSRIVFSEEEGCWCSEFFIIPEELDKYGPIIAKCVRLMGMSNDQHLEVLMTIQYGEWSTPLNNLSYMVSQKAGERMNTQ
jgi:hypothetical protein